MVINMLCCNLSERRREREKRREKRGREKRDIQMWGGGGGDGKTGSLVRWKGKNNRKYP